MNCAWRRNTHRFSYDKTIKAYLLKRKWAYFGRGCGADASSFSIKTFNNNNNNKPQNVYEARCEYVFKSPFHLSVLPGIDIYHVFVFASNNKNA